MQPLAKVLALHEGKDQGRTLNDSLTGLANRGFFNDCLTQAVARGRRNEHRIALLFVDLDNFKAVNETFGCKVGDKVLRAVDDALRGAIRPTDRVVRLGGDEFAVLIEPLEPVSDMDVMAGKMLSAIRTPIIIEQMQIKVTASMGIATFPDDANKPGVLLHFAGARMFSAKKCGGDNFEFYADI